MSKHVFIHHQTVEGMMLSRDDQTPDLIDIHNSSGTAICLGSRCVSHWSGSLVIGELLDSVRAVLMPAGC